MNWSFLLVGLVYLGLVLLLRRARAPIPWSIAGFFYALVLLFFFRPLTGPFVNVPADYLFDLYPWRGLKHFPKLSNGEMNDIIMQIMPWAHQVRESFREGLMPLWNNSAGGGYPLLGNGQSAPFSPFRLLSLPLSLGQAFAAEGAWKILVALTFAFLFFRRRGTASTAAVLAAVSFSFCSFLMIWLHFPHATVASLMPMLFYAIELLLERVSYPRFLFCVVAFLVLLLCGQPEVASHVVLASVVWFGHRLFSIPRGERWRVAGVTAAAGIVALILALPVVLPLLESVPRTLRYQVLQVQPAHIQRGAWNSFVPSIQVGFYGALRVNIIWGPAIAEMLGGFAGVLAAISWFALLSRVIRRRLWKGEEALVLIASALALMISFGTPVISDIFHSLPIFSMAANARLRLVFCWFASMAVAMAFDHLIKERDARDLLTGLAVIFTILVSLVLFTRYPAELHRDYSLMTTIPRAVVLAVLAVVLLLRGRAFRWGAVVLVVAVTYDLWAFGYPWNPTLPSHDLYPSTPLIRELQARQKKSPDPFRIGSTSGGFFPNSAAIFGLEDLRAHDPMANGRYLGLLRLLARYTTSQYFAMLKAYDHPLFDYLNVRYVVVSPRETLTAPKLREIYSGFDGKIYENVQALPRFFAARNVVNEFDDTRRNRMILANEDWVNTAFVKRLPTWMVDVVKHDLLTHHESHERLAKVRVVQKSPREFTIDVEAPRWTMIVSSQPHWPGWRAYRNGGEELKMIEVNALFTAFLVPRGTSKVTVIYRPRSFYTSALVSLITMLVLAAIYVREKRRVRLRERSG